MAAEKIGFEPYQLTKIDSISHAYFLAGDALLIKHDFVNADARYDDAIKITQGQCPGLARQSRDQVYYRAGNGDIPGAKDKYMESIALNINATNNDKNFSDAHYRIGLAHQRTGDYDLALKAYNEAVRSNDQNALAFTERGNTYQVLKKYDKAAEDYAQAIIILKNDLDQAKKSSKDSWLRLSPCIFQRFSSLTGRPCIITAIMPVQVLVLDPAIETTTLMPKPTITAA